MTQLRSRAVGEATGGHDFSALFDLHPRPRHPATDASRVAIGCGPLSAAIVAAQVIPVCQRSGRAVTLAVGDLDRAIALVAAGTLDFAIDCLGATVLPAALVARPIGIVPSLLFVRAGHPLAGIARLAPRALAGWALALPETWPAFDRWFTRHAGTTADVALRCNDFALIGAAVAASDLIGCASAATLADLQRWHDVLPLTALRPDIDQQIRCITPRGGPRSDAAAAVLSEIERVFSSH